VCVFNKTNRKGVQCTVCVHVDDLMSKSKSMIHDLTQGLTKRYGEISLKHGPVINYLGMVFDFTYVGQVVVTMSGYTDDVLKSSNIPGTARTPGTDGLFEVRDSASPVPEEVRVWFHRLVQAHVDRYVLPHVGIQEGSTDVHYRYMPPLVHRHRCQGKTALVVWI
jgi:hypothetical protein